MRPKCEELAYSHWFTIPEMRPYLNNNTRGAWSAGNRELAKTDKQSQEMIISNIQREKQEA